MERWLVPASAVGTACTRSRLTGTCRPSMLSSTRTRPEIVQAVEHRELLGKRPGREPHRRADLQIGPQVEEALGVSGGEHRFNDARRGRAGQVAAHDQARYAERAVDAAPAVAAQIEDDEQIAGEERGYDGRKLSRVANGFAPFRQKGRKPLRFELDLGSFFGERQGMDRIPSLALASRDGTRQRRPSFRTRERSRIRGCAEPAAIAITPLPHDVVEFYPRQPQRIPP